MKWKIIKRVKMVELGLDIYPINLKATETQRGLGSSQQTASTTNIRPFQTL